MLSSRWGYEFTSLLFGDSNQIRVCTEYLGQVRLLVSLFRQGNPLVVPKQGSEMGYTASCVF